MKYFKLIYDFENDNDYVLVKSSDNDDKYDKEIFKGEFIGNWEKDIKFEYNDDEGQVFSDYLASDNGWFIVSKKFCDVMQEVIEEDVQYLDINIMNINTKEENNTYKVLNVTKHLKALDLKTRFMIFLN